MNYFDFYVEHEYAFAATQLTLAMLGMGAKLTAGDFAVTLQSPKALVFGIVFQLVIVPAIAALMIHGLALEPGLAIGLALCAAIAGGTGSNIFTFFAKGNVALSILLTAICTLISLATVPVVLHLLISDHLPQGFDMPYAQIATEIGLFLLLPLSMGMLVLQRWPRFADSFSKVMMRLTIIVIALIVIGAEGSGRLDQEAFGKDNMARVVQFMLILAIISAALPWLFGLNRREIAAINLEVVVRNINLALLIKASLFPADSGTGYQMGDHVFFTALMYGGLSLMSGAILVALHRGLPLVSSALTRRASYPPCTSD